ncbi:hypothetical protein PoB_001163600 [Plakobranchus ocellatus]|uniref:Uncharacterized protein n=1 Tax=Plakobranchus ocellatus TaxID=259542 RepID=A0AAV3YCR9_9GAST|nr:hypothetical protein PoB_001163600 [Plakobranchus ocellatus]
MSHRTKAKSQPSHTAVLALVTDDEDGNAGGEWGNDVLRGHQFHRCPPSFFSHSNVFAPLNNFYTNLISHVLSDFCSHLTELLKTLVVNVINVNVSMGFAQSCQ